MAEVSRADRRRCARALETLLEGREGAEAEVAGEILPALSEGLLHELQGAASRLGRLARLDASGRSMARLRSGLEGVAPQ